MANSLEQLAACGIRSVFGLGLGGTTPQDHVQLGDILLPTFSKTPLKLFLRCHAPAVSPPVLA
jgi:hypothetical protein